MGEVTREELENLKREIDKTCKRVDDVLSNHIPHIYAQLAKIEGGVSTLKWMIPVGLTIIGVIVTVILALA